MRAIRQLVAIGSNLPSTNVIPGNDPNPSPCLPYSTVTLIYDSTSGDSWSTTTATTDTTYRSSELAVSVTWFGDNADDLASRFTTWCSSAVGLGEFSRRNVVFYRVGQIRDDSSIVRKRLQQRRQVDLIVGVISRVETPIDIATTFDVDICAHSDSDDSTLDAPATVVDVEVDNQPRRSRRRRRRARRQARSRARREPV